MKSLLIGLTMFFSTFSKASFAAGGEKITPAVLKSFNSTFSTAKEVDWSVSEHFFKAQFLLNDSYVTAYYLSDGSMAAIARNVTLSQLPVALQAQVKKEYDAYWVSDLFEITTETATQYYITLENGDGKVILKSASNVDWSTYQKAHK